MTATTTPLTDAELDYVQDACGPVASRAAAEIRALRASEARLLAALRGVIFDGTTEDDSAETAAANAKAAIQKAIEAIEGRVIA